MKRLVSKATFPSSEQVEMILQQFEQKQMSQGDFVCRAKELDEKMEMEEECEMNFWTPDLLQKIDALSVKVFSSCKAEIGMMEASYLRALPTYVRDLEKVLEQEKRGNPILPLVLGRLKWVMTVKKDAAIPMPIVTEFTLEAMCQSLSKIRHAIDEVSLLGCPS
jgi:hypothetical protein